MIWIGVVVGAVLVGAVVTLVAARSGDLAPLPSSRRDVRIPADEPLSAADLRELGFNRTWRGYAPDEVDGLVRRLAREAAEREAPEESRPEPADD